MLPLRLASEPEALGTRPSNRSSELDPPCATRIAPHVVGDGKSGKGSSLRQSCTTAESYSASMAAIASLSQPTRSGKEQLGPTASSKGPHSARHWILMQRPQTMLVPFSQQRRAHITRTESMSFQQALGETWPPRSGAISSLYPPRWLPNCIDKE